MRKELQTQLYQKYPKIFKEKDLDITLSAMGWGFQCDDGWYNLLDNLCRDIQSYIDNNKKVKQVIATTVKEKYGTLRFYYTGGDDEINDMVNLAEDLSGEICEICGSTRKVKRNIEGYIQTRCRRCRIKKVIRDIIDDFYYSNLYDIKIFLINIIDKITGRK